MELDSKELKKLEKELKALEKSPLKTGDGKMTASDGKEYSFRGAETNVRKWVSHLPEEEIETFASKAKEFQKINGQILALKNKLNKNPAFKQGGYMGLLLKNKEQEILEKFGKMYSSEEIHKIVVQEWGYDKITLKQIVKFELQNQDDIFERREKYQKDINGVRLSHKRSRLDELQNIYLAFKQRQDDMGLSKNTSEMLLKILEQVRKEVEGQQIHINGQIKVEHELAIQDHVNKEVMKSLNIQDIIIGRLCARLNVNPKYILYRLHTSYYKKFTGFLPEEMSDDNEIEYPSQIVYDFNRIRALNEELNIQDIPYKEVVEPKDPEKALSLKDKLKAKIEAKREQNKKR